MNIAYLIEEQSRLNPEKKSVVFSKKEKIGFSYPYYTFKTFHERSNQMSHFLTSQGVQEGMRVCLFVRPSLDFSVIVFSLFKLGAIPVLIDPGMGLKSVLNAVKDISPEVLIAEKIVHVIKMLRPQFFKTIKVSLTPDVIKSSLSQQSKEFDIIFRDENEMAAILFTSGGTGRPKGVKYTHGMLYTQTHILKKMYDLTPLEKDLPGFPLFALFTLAMGMTSVIPHLNPAMPSSVRGEDLVQNIINENCTFLAGSPAIWRKLSDYCYEKKIQLPSVKNLVMFGAPVSPDLLIRLREIFPFGRISTPYGATECLPVSLVFSDEILNTHLEKTKLGFGICVGKPVEGVEILIDKDADIPNYYLKDKGEILVKAKQQTIGYFGKDEDTRKVKANINGEIYHRMGDVGTIDSEGNLWFLGRKVHQVILNQQSFSPISVESFFNQHPEIKRTAFVQESKDTAALVVELSDDKKSYESLLKDLRLILDSSPYKNVFNKVYFHSSFPVDVRHNIKIDRNKLSEYVKNNKGYLI